MGQIRRKIAPECLEIILLLYKLRIFASDQHLLSNFLRNLEQLVESPNHGLV